MGDILFYLFITQKGELNEAELKLLAAKLGDMKCRKKCETWMTAGNSGHSWNQNHMYEHHEAENSDVADM